MGVTSCKQLTRFRAYIYNTLVGIRGKQYDQSKANNIMDDIQ